MKPLEVFIVLGIVLIFWCTWAVNGIGVPMHGRASMCRASLVRIGEGLERYARAHDGAYPERLAQLVPGYLDKLPACPAAGSDTYSASYRGGKSFRIFCLGEHHDRAATADHPRLVSGQDVDSGYHADKPARYRPWFPRLALCLMVLSLAWFWLGKRTFPRFVWLLAFTTFVGYLAWKDARLAYSQAGLSRCMEELRAQGFARENASTDEFTLICPGHSHAPDMPSAGYPLYSSVEGLIERP